MATINVEDAPLIGQVCAFAFIALIVCAAFALHRCWRRSLKEHGMGMDAETQLLLLREGRRSGYGTV